MKWILILSLSFLCCNNNRTISSTLPIDSTKVAKPKKEFKFSSVSLFSIDPSFYDKDDTITFFPDGKPAYKLIFGGGSFIDSTGRPIHDRYKKHDLDEQEITTLKEKFLSKLCFGYRKMCVTTYRDVLIFYDSKKKVLAQAPICFRCNEVFIYPAMDEICDVPNLNFKEFKQYISDIKLK